MAKSGKIDSFFQKAENLVEKGEIDPWALDQIRLHYWDAQEGFEVGESAGMRLNLSGMANVIREHAHSQSAESLADQIESYVESLYD